MVLRRLQRMLLGRFRLPMMGGSIAVSLLEYYANGEHWTEGV